MQGEHVFVCAERGPGREIGESGEDIATGASREGIHDGYHWILNDSSALDLELEPRRSRFPIPPYGEDKRARAQENVRGGHEGRCKGVIVAHEGGDLALTAAGKKLQNGVRPVKKLPYRQGGDVVQGAFVHGKPKEHFALSRHVPATAQHDHVWSMNCDFKRSSRVENKACSRWHRPELNDRGPGWWRAELVVHPGDSRKVQPEAQIERRLHNHRVRLGRVQINENASKRRMAVYGRNASPVIRASQTNLPTARKHHDVGDGTIMSGSANEHSRDFISARLGNLKQKSKVVQHSVQQQRGVPTQRPLVVSKFVHHVTASLLSSQAYN